MIGSRDDMSSDRTPTMATTSHSPADLAGFRRPAALHNVGWNEYAAWVQHELIPRRARTSDNL